MFQKSFEILFKITVQNLKKNFFLNNSSNVISNPCLHQFSFAQKKQNPLQNITFTGIHQKGGEDLRNGMLSYFCYILWSLDFNSFLLTKPSSKLSRKRKRKEDKQEAKRKKELEFFLYEELFPYETLCTSVGREVLGGAWCSCVSFLSHLMRVSEKSKKFQVKSSYVSK